jgi:SAM-dependent methyltransferase
MNKNLRGSEQPLIYLRAATSETGNLRLVRQPFDFATDAPPPHLMQYSEPPQRHLNGGKSVAEKLKTSLAAAGYSFQPGHRFMDFGCANARVLRWLKDWAEAGEGWGVDINANVIMWCLEHMSPPFHFGVTSTNPHLPFESRYFNLIFCNSVFTHIDDMFFSWLQELRRVVTIGGYLFVTILDEASTERMRNSPESFMGSRFSDDPDLTEFSNKKEDLVGIRRGKGAMVFVRAEYFETLVRPWFDIGGRIENAVGSFQAGYVLIRRK